MGKKQKIILIILTVIGLLLSLELTHIFIKANFLHGVEASFCSISQTIDCDGVAKTSYSMFLGIPLAIWGLILYSIILFLTFVDKIQEKFKNTIFDVFKTPNSYIATLGLISFACSILLAGISIFKINKICYLCFITYFIDLLIAFAAKTKGSFFIIDIKNTIVDFIAGVKKYTLLFIIVAICGIGALYYTETSLIFSPNQKKERGFLEFTKMEKNIYAIKGNTLGNPNAAIKVYVYGDFLCPFCKTTNTMVHKLAREVKNIEIIHQNFPLDTTCNSHINATMHTGSCMLSQYALAAQKQGNYWGMVSGIYDKIPQNEEQLLLLGQNLGLDIEKLQKDAHSNEIKNILKGQIELAISNKVYATPSMIISDILYHGTMPYDDLVLKVKQAQKRYERDKKNN